MWARGQCQSKSIRGDELEAQVWSDIESYLRNPASVLQPLRTRLEVEVRGSERTRKRLTQLEGQLEQKAPERSRVVSLFRRGRLTAAVLA